MFLFDFSHLEEGGNKNGFIKEKYLVHSLPSLSFGLKISYQKIVQYDLPFFGIGAGIHTDGQLVISNDMLGNFVGDIDPKFVRKYANISDIVIDSFTKYKNDIKNLDFPSEENFYTIDQETLTEIEKYFKK